MSMTGVLSVIMKTFYINELTRNYSARANQYLEKKNIHIYIRNIFSVKFTENFLSTHLRGGLLSLLLNSAMGENLNNSDFKLAFHIDLLFCCSEILDDYVDEELNHESGQLEEKKIILNTLALTIDSVNFICENSNKMQAEIILDSLLNSINSEYNDITTKLDRNISLDFYWSNILPKSLSLSKLITALLNYPHQQINLFFEYICIVQQLRNDAHDILRIDKSDLRLRRISIPTIKSIEYAEKYGNFNFINFMLNSSITNDNELKKARDFIKFSGSIEYTLELARLYYNEAYEILMEFPDRLKPCQKLLENIFFKKDQFK